MCHGDAYGSLTGLAFGLIALWPLGVPLLFFALLLVANRTVKAGRAASALLRAVSFLHAEYKPSLFFWE